MMLKFTCCCLKGEDMYTQYYTGVTGNLNDIIPLCLLHLFSTDYFQLNTTHFVYFSIYLLSTDYYPLYHSYFPIYLLSTDYYPLCLLPNVSTFHWLLPTLSTSQFIYFPLITSHFVYFSIYLLSTDYFPLCLRFNLSTFHFLLPTFPIYLLSSLGLGRYIDTSMHRDTDLADTCIDSLGAVSRYF